MKRGYLQASLLGLAGVSALAVGVMATHSTRAAEPNAPSGKPVDAALERSRKMVNMLDTIYKQTIVLITDKYVHTEDDYAAGSAAVDLFAAISKGGSHHVRLIDATGEPYDEDNVAKDAFEKEGIKRLLAGAASHEQVVEQDGERKLRVVTAVPVVLDRCIMCHAHYADAKKDNLPIGAISYTVPVE